MKIQPLFLTAFAFLQVACGQLAPGDVSPEPPVSVTIATEAAGVLGTIPVATPATATAASAGASATELRYRVLDHFPDLFFCDPDFYPVARADEADLARQRFPELQADTAEFQAILEHIGLGGLTAFTDEQQLLIYREHKRLAAIQFQPSGAAYQFQLLTEEENNQGYLVTGTIDATGSVAILERQPTIATCPICLASFTLVDTPQGRLAVEALRPGDLVWTLDASGERLALPILRMTRVLVPADHRLVHVVLDDGRQLWASPGHPTADGRRLADLQPGDSLDGGWVTRIGHLPYHLPATYDLLPAGSTGYYWAGGILVASTLSQE